MEPVTSRELVLRCTVCAYPQVRAWIASGADGAEQVAAHDPGVDLKVEVLAGAVEIGIGGVVRVYRAGECVILPAGVPRELRPFPGDHEGPGSD